MTDADDIWATFYRLVHQIEALEAAANRFDAQRGVGTQPPAPDDAPARSGPATQGQVMPLEPHSERCDFENGVCIHHMPTGQGGGELAGKADVRTAAPRNPVPQMHDFTERSSAWHRNAMRGSIAAQWTGTCAICDNSIGLDSPIRKTLNEAGRYVWGHYDCIQAVEDRRERR